MTAVRGMPEEIVRKVKRIAHDLTRSLYVIKRDELMRQARSAIANGENVDLVLETAWRSALANQLPSTGVGTCARGDRT